MKKIFKIPKFRSGFYIRMSEPLIGNDVNSYVIQWDLGSDMTGAQMIVSAKRADGEVITDCVYIDADVAEYTMKNNMYSVPGEVNVRIQISMAGVMCTECQIVFDALESYEQDATGDDRIPALSALISQAQETINKLNEYVAEEKIFIENAMEYKGECSESKLPREGAKGDVYKLIRGTDKKYMVGSFYTLSGEGKFSGMNSQAIYTDEEYTTNISNNSNLTIGYIVYDIEWNEVYSGNGFYFEIEGWCDATGDNILDVLEEGKPYYITRADYLEPVNERLPRGTTYTYGYAVHNGVSFEKLYSSKTVDKKLESKAELIEEITISGDSTKKITRTAEPDGTPYNFKAVRVYVYKQPWTVSNVVVSEIYDSESNKLSSYRSSLTASETAGKFHQASYDVFAGSWTCLGVFGTPQSVPMTAQIWRNPTVYNGENISKITVYGDTDSFEADTLIRIYGVRV